MLCNLSQHERDLPAALQPSSSSTPGAKGSPGILVTVSTSSQWSHFPPKGSNINVNTTTLQALNKLWFLPPSYILN